LFAIEAMATVGGTLMSVGIFFFMNHRFGWQTQQNFLLAAAQGVVYVPGALLAGPIAARFGKWRALSGVYLLLGIIAGLAAALARLQHEHAALLVAAALLAYTFVIGMSWPILEGLAASGGSPAGMARRVSLYNVIWPAGGALVIAVEGTILKYWIAGVFLIPALLNFASLWVIAWCNLGKQVAAEQLAPVDHPQPEPKLVQKRRLAMWLSRTALPATYTVVYGLMPLMPSLPTMSHLPTTTQTLAASVWLITRWLAFLVLAAGSWWHTRPQALVWSAVLMMFAFFGMTLRPTAGAWPEVDLAAFILWQALLGAALGMIYSGSLYFGMVLSEGSTEHGGYHEALIGLGWILGPAAGAAAQAIQPNNPWIGIAAVGAVIILSVAVVLATAWVMRQPGARNQV
jgi:MFS family permease